MEDISFSDTRSDFQIFAKPAGPICNLDCQYCYYLENEHLYPDERSFRMSDRLLDEYIVQHIEATEDDEVRFSWHGGEPTLAGVDYYRNIVSSQHKHLPDGKRAINGIVTNGTLIDEEWCRFLAREGFAVGLSLDGPRDLHDAYRVTKGQKTTHKQVMQAFKLLKQHRIPCDILCVVHNRNVNHPLQVYDFFKEIGATFLGFLPLVARQNDLSAGVSDHSVTAGAFGLFLCTIFDQWVRNDIGRIMVQIFDEAARPVRELEHSLCIFRETCGNIPALEYNGDFYPCDHYVDSNFLVGNIRRTSIAELLKSPAQLQFGRDKRDTLPRFCLECNVLAMCNGGCPKDRFIATPDGEDGLNYLCEGFKQFFTHARPVMERLVPLWKSGASPAQLMAAARGVEQPKVPRTGRNLPCPCGSGLKYKNCCMGK